MSLEVSTTLEIVILMKRDHRTIKKFLSAGQVTHSEPNRTKPKALGSRDLQKNIFLKKRTLFHQQSYF